MDSKAFTQQLAARLGVTPAEVTPMVEGLGQVIAEIGTALDSVAIPGFGTFTSEKRDEHVVTDPVDGSRTLMPPAIEMSFTASVVLRKKLAQ